MSIAQIARCLVLEPTHPDSCSRLGMGDRIYQDFNSEFNRGYFSIVGDWFVDIDSPMMTSPLSYLSTKSLEDDYKGRTCVRAPIRP